MTTQEVYRPGDTKYESRPGGFAQGIKEMRDKKGYIAKRITFNPEKFKTFEDFKRYIQLCSEAVDAHLKKFLPNYYYTFEENPEDPKSAGAYFFMEDIEKDAARSGEEFLAQLDEFTSSCIEFYLTTYRLNQTRDKKADKLTGISIDLARRNLVYGHSLADPSTRLYFVDLYPVYLSKNPSKIGEEIQEFLKPYLNKGFNFPRTKQAYQQLIKLE